MIELSRTRWLTLVSTTLVVMALAFGPANENVVGFSTAFFPAFLASIFLIELMTSYLLWQQFQAQGEIHMLGLSLTYLCTALLLIPNALVHPHALDGSGILEGNPSSASWLWIAWHVLFPLGLALSLAPWSPRIVHYVRDSRQAVGRWALGAVVVGVGGLGFVFTRGSGQVPFVGGVLDYPRMTGTFGPWVLLVCVIALVAVIARSHSNHALERWILVAAAAITGDTLLTVAAGDRLTIGWYAGRALALAATGVVLVGLTREVGRMYREALISIDMLREQNERDALTGVYSRRAILDRADSLMHSPHELSMAVLDLDHFKSINDTYGHPVGDEVLVWVAGRMASCLRAGDAVGRLGGEEFIVLLPGASSGAAARAAERIRRALADSTIATASGHVRVTASLGIATRTADDRTPTSILTRADEALYVAKAAGRNQVKTSGEGVLVES